MNLRLLYALVVAWVVLLLGPATLIALGAFGRVDMETNLTGAMFGLWIGGYLAQFFVFMWLMNVAKEQKVLWWIGASLLPWAIDWTTPASPLFFALWVPIVLGIAYWIVAAASGEEAFRERGVRATGTVLQVYRPMMNVVINNVYIKRKLRVRVHRSDGMPEYEGDLNGLFMIGNIPSPGDRLQLLVDPQNQQRFEIVDSDSTDTASYSPQPSSDNSDDVATALDKLSKLRDKGAISDSEFAAAKKKVLDS